MSAGFPLPLLLLLVLLLLMLCGTGAMGELSFEAVDLQRSPRVVGGHRSEVRHQPHMVNIRRNGNFECGGSLVTPYCVLTAAHCLVKGQPEDFVVRGGVTFLSDIRHARHVKNILLPSAYSHSTLDHDVALLQLQQPLKAPIARPIRLAIRSPRAGSFVRVSGWGLTDEGSTQLPNQLHSVHVRVMGRQECQKLYDGYRNITESMYCASVPGHKDACAADSGGPVVNANGLLVGVVSWGKANRCAHEDSPGVYSDVSYLSDWITDTMRRYC
ncbi:GL25238 [Drosophila persimilis]|uniref:trypsin n=1 Tax=Drosophila persimilis TaxID=7234 RepID=B4GRP2_DROPE|nr:GL25238 [Drosophila persimilis]